MHVYGSMKYAGFEVLNALPPVAEGFEGRVVQLDDGNIFGFHQGEWLLQGSLTQSVTSQPSVDPLDDAGDILALDVDGKLNSGFIRDDARLPAQSDPATVNQFLQSDGTNANWVTFAGSGLNPVFIDETYAGSYQTGDNYIMGHSTAFTINLPPATDGDRIGFMNSSEAASWADENVTLVADGSDTIDGDPTLICDVDRVWVELYAEAGNWQTRDPFQPVGGGGSGGFAPVFVTSADSPIIPNSNTNYITDTTGGMIDFQLQDVNSTFQGFSFQVSDGYANAATGEKGNWHINPVRLIPAGSDEIDEDGNATFLCDVQNSNCTIIAEFGQSRWVVEDDIVPKDQDGIVEATPTVAGVVRSVTPDIVDASETSKGLSSFSGFFEEFSIPVPNGVGTGATCVAYVRREGNIVTLQARLETSSTGPFSSTGTTDTDAIPDWAKPIGTVYSEFTPFSFVSNLWTQVSVSAGGTLSFLKYDMDESDIRTAWGANQTSLWSTISYPV